MARLSEAEAWANYIAYLEGRYDLLKIAFKINQDFCRELISKIDIQELEYFEDKIEDAPGVDIIDKSLLYQIIKPALFVHNGKIDDLI